MTSLDYWIGMRGIHPLYDFAPVVPMTIHQRLARWVSSDGARYYPTQKGFDETVSAWLPVVNWPSWLGFSSAENCLAFLDGDGKRLDSHSLDFGV